MTNRYVIVLATALCGLQFAGILYFELSGWMMFIWLWACVPVAGVIAHIFGRGAAQK